ncbi:MAG: site-specific DNA-methyltransferase [Lachnospiraceae bacterium]|nr:site-specific DNA-methyltransferase [Lachnospiraceae bacterium]
MANITKQKRDQMLAFLEELKKEHSDDASVRAFNEIENHLKDKKFGLVFEEHTEAVDELLNTNIPVFTEDESRKIISSDDAPWSFIIEGDNLQALYLLEKTHFGKVSCIYIDPPYNTGAKDWKYNNDYVDSNDVYRHSKWLSMMKTRLRLAKRLLDPDNSILICTIDEKEYLHLGCLLEEMFPEASIQMISSVINRAGTGRKYEFSRTDEYLFFVRLGKASIAMEKTEGENTPVTWDTLRRSGPSNTRDKTSRQFYPVFVNDTTKLIQSVGDPIPKDMDISEVVAPKGCTAVFPIRDNGIEMMWGCVKEEFLRRLEKGYLRVGKYTPQKPQKYVISYLTSGIISDIESGKAFVDSYNEDGSVNAFYYGNKEIPPTTNWNKPTHDAQWYGSNLIKAILGPNRFTYPKSLYAVRDCINYATHDKKDAIIVDFFAGSGTTGHAVNLLNAEDGGRRSFILVTNNEISEAEEKEFKKRDINKGDIEWEEKGIAKYVTFPRTKCSIEGKDINGNNLVGDYISVNGTPIPMSDGFNSNVKYFKCDWTPRRPEDYLLSNALCLHIKEMIELQNAIEIDGYKNVLLLNKDDIKKNILNPEMYEKAENIWLNQNIVLNSEEIKLLKKKGFKYIPREFFGQELKEVAE